MKKVILEYRLIDHDNKTVRMYCFVVIISHEFDLNEEVFNGIVFQITPKLEKILTDYMLISKELELRKKEINIEGNLKQVDAHKKIKFKYAKGAKPQQWNDVFKYQFITDLWSNYQFDPKNKTLEEFSTVNVKDVKQSGGSLFDYKYKYSKYKMKYNNLLNEIK